MTREIKFRAWDVRGEQMYEVSQLVSKSSEEGWLCFTPNNPLALAEYILLQSTGLKDKNGIDIYEGDIVTIRFWHNNPPSKRPKIKYVDINLPVVFGNGSFHISDSPRIPQYGTRYGKEFEQCEIIGNVYQHPNLINQ